MPKSISIAITGSAAPLRKALKEADSLLGGFTSKISPKVLAAGAAFGAVATSAVVMGRAFANAAAEDEKAQRQLALALRNTAGANDATIASTEKYVEQLMLATGVADDELRPALAGLVRATGDLYSAQQLLGLALDVSAGTGRDLTSVQIALAKAANGNMGALTKIGIPLDENIVKSKDFGKATAELQKLFAGAAATSAETYAGTMQRLKVRIGELQESLGQKLLPLLERMVEIGIAGVDTFNEQGLTGVMRKLGDVIAGLGRNADGTVSDLGTLFNGLATLYNGITRIINLTRPGEDFPLINKLEDLSPVLWNAQNATSNYNDKLLKLNERYGETAGQVQRNITSLATLTTETGKAEKPVDKVAERLKNLRAALRDAKDAAQEYVTKIAAAITGTISLGSALDVQKSAEENVAKAIEDRDAAQRRSEEAYNRALLAGTVEGWLDYEAAVRDAKDAEEALGRARAAREDQSYTNVFRKQVEAAKEFAGNLKALIAAGLRGAGLEQVLNLGPVAGNQVAKDLLAGVGGLTVGGLMSTLAEAEATARSVGLSIPDVAGVLGATAGRTQGNIYLTVQAGVGDPAAIGATVVDYLQKYQQRVGRLPLKVA